MLSTADHTLERDLRGVNQRNERGQKQSLDPTNPKSTMLNPKPQTPC